MLERISRRERYDLIIAWLAISIAFSLAFTGGVGVWMGSPFQQTTLGTYLVYLILSMVTVGVGFVLHELAHKFTAMKFGYWAEFRKDNLMLLVAVVLAALVGVVFAAPGCNDDLWHRDHPGTERHNICRRPAHQSHPVHPLCTHSAREQRP